VGEEDTVTMNRPAAETANSAASEKNPKIKTPRRWAAPDQVWRWHTRACISCPRIALSPVCKIFLTRIASRHHYTVSSI
jgi:hypothetical protein